MYLDAKDLKRARSAFVDRRRCERTATIPAVLNGRARSRRAPRRRQGAQPLAQMLETPVAHRAPRDRPLRSRRRLGRLAESRARRQAAGHPRVPIARGIALARASSRGVGAALCGHRVVRRSDRSPRETRRSATNASARARSRFARRRYAHRTHQRSRARHHLLDRFSRRSTGHRAMSTLKVIPLLEQEKKWDKLATILAEDADSRAGRRADPHPLEARTSADGAARGSGGRDRRLRPVWAIDPKEPTTRQALEKMLAAPEARARGRDMLEPVYRNEGAHGAAVARSRSSRRGSGRRSVAAGALDEATQIAERDLNATRSARWSSPVGRLSAAVETAMSASRSVHVSKPRSLAGEPRGTQSRTRRSLAARSANCARSPGAFDLAKRAGQALVSAGDPSGPSSCFGARSPSSLRRASSCSDRRPLGRRRASRRARGPLSGRARSGREPRSEGASSYHAIGTIERRDLGDPRAAIVTWRQALAENPSECAASGAARRLRGGA